MQRSVAVMRDALAAHDGNLSISTLHNEIIKEEEINT
jgi:hypothetical protein